MPAIHLLPLGEVPAQLLLRLVAPLEARFAAPVAVDPPEPIRPDWLRPDGARYDAHAIVRDLVADPPPDGGWRLAVLDGDIAAPGVEAAAGLATVGGCCGLLALARLRPEGPQAPAAADLVFRRALTEAVHELGHLAGLDHCPDEHCVMYLSRTLEDTDRKAPNFCERCRQ